MTAVHYLILFIVAFAATVALTPVVRHIATRCGVVDMPGPRRVNKKPIPRLGGAAMYCGLLVALIVEIACEAAGVWQGPFVTPAGVNTKLLGLVLGLTVIVLVGAVDDIRSLSPKVKFLGQILAAVIIAATGTLLENFKMPFTNTHVEVGWLSYPITVVYLVCFANIINLIDGLDGLAAGITGIASLSLFVLTVGLSRGDAATFAIILVAICAGFLIYNFSPASIFMGDSGSLLLGTLLGAVSLLGAARFSSITALAVPVVIAGVPVIDTLSAIVRRMRGHQSISTPDAGHIHHRLLRQGMSQRKAVLVIYGWTILLCAAGCIIWTAGGVLKYVVLILVLVVSSVIIWRLGLFGPVLQHHYYPDGGVSEQSAAASDED